MVLQVSDGYRKVEEVGAVHLHQVASKYDFMAPSYGPEICFKLTMNKLTSSNI